MLTVSEIKEILKRERISISKRRGQNFLIDPHMQKRIIEAIDIKPTDEILEIGPGLGALTQYLAEQAGVVFAVEKDRALTRVLSEMLSGYKNLKLIHQDILKTNVAALTQRTMKIVGNLPYYITTPIIGHLLESQRDSLKAIFVTIQEEVGKRMLAQPGSKDYSALTIFVRYFTDARRLFSIPKRAFYPQPKVDSVFVHLRILDKPRVKVNNQQQFFKIVRRCFSQRRKTILNSLAHKLKKDRIEKALRAEGLDVGLRPETLSIEEFAKIEDIFYKRRIRVE